MHRLLFLLLVAAVAQPAAAQKIIEKTAPVTAGQRVFLNLRQASTIHIHAGAGSKVTIKASVNINQNKLNDALLLTTDQTGGELKFTAEINRPVIV